ncbi:hypothetical protein BCY86_07940 [Pajaroellobacter abortibovis]|uniref:Uncharacterized protein n=2 Tax=Pajaroellobacter abortibovis TaxID=1882918 RepID=A0A1L6N044_9BACT|nr:hypothetical protein BCY86_07940 [Pajaroellobacter abortibovis]
MRLDKAVVRLTHGMSRACVKRAVQEGMVSVNGVRRAKGWCVSTGEVIALENMEKYTIAPALPCPEASLTLRLVSDAALIADKPAGQPTAPLRSLEVGTLANALVGHYPELAGIGYSPREPGLLHRLDTYTSGLVLVARHQKAFEVFSDALRSGNLCKRYLLVCASDGLPESGEIAFPIAAHPKDARKIHSCVHSYDQVKYAHRPALTTYRVVRRVHRWALVEAQVNCALRHQIRVHFMAIGYPLVGDSLYGGELIHGFNRHALHASYLFFKGKDGFEPWEVNSPLPPEMEALLVS